MVRMNEAENLLRQLSEQLGVEYEPQDWGIANANPDRLEEFITYFRSQKLLPTQQFEMAELILASANERLLSGDEVIPKELLALSDEFPAAFEQHIGYWTALADKLEFPLAIALRFAGSENRGDG